MQARHVMPFLVVIPLLAGEIIAHRGLRRWSVDVALTAIVFLAAIIHVIAWYMNARRQAVAPSTVRSSSFPISSGNRPWVGCSGSP